MPMRSKNFQNCSGKVNAPSKRLPSLQMCVWAPSTWELYCRRRKSISLQDARWTVLEYTCVVTSEMNVHTTSMVEGDVGATLSCGIEVGGNELPSPSPESLRYRTAMILLRLALLPKGRFFPFDIGWRGETPTFQKTLVTQNCQHLYNLEQISAVSKTKPLPSSLAFTTPWPTLH
jgi:hypothetical protein